MLQISHVSKMILKHSYLIRLRVNSLLLYKCEEETFDVHTTSVQTLIGSSYDISRQ